MYLREIEIKGFKSFSDRTILQFPKGISAIVGPNGSGKSNVVDALKWVLGEQSSKSLRTDSSVNLIFSGNEFKPAGQSAKVRLTFDEINHPEIIDANTLEIEKVIYRDGKTEYFLNKKDTRQKDLVELLASLQLGTKGLSIISQGSIENILKVSPFDRKIMFEEILGLRQLEIKKESSEKKLENTNINLDKVTALINEILPHFRSLKRYVSRFDKQQEYQNELIENSIKYYGFRFKHLKENNEKINLELKTFDDKILEIENSINTEKSKLGFSDSKDDNAISSLNQKQKEIEAIVKELNNQKQALVYEMAKLEGQIDEKLMANQRLNQAIPTPKIETKPKYIAFESLSLKFSIIKQLIKNIFDSDDILAIKSNIVSIEKELNEILAPTNENLISSEIVDNSEKVNEIKTAIESLKTRIDEFKLKINEINQNISSKDNEANLIEDEIEKESKQQREMFSSIEQKQRELMALQHQKQSLSLEFEKNNINVENLKDQVSSMNLDFEFIVNHETVKELFLTDSDLKLAYDKIERLRAILNELGFVDQNIIDEYNDTQKRIEFLETQKADLEKAVADLRSIIRELALKINNTFETAIKGINHEFNKYLEMIFGGGKGTLEIVEFKDKSAKKEEGEESQEVLPLEVESERKIGLDIKVKLPKTKLDGVEALSGGEKSLVSIALLFAIVAQSKPPLLVLDEVDAALDEENTRKFSNILRDLSNSTQYLVITHNWLTMSSASVIYGVTIDKEKSSQILSLELEDSREFMKN